jgi:hypothetical protein
MRLGRTALAGVVTMIVAVYAAAFFREWKVLSRPLVCRK